MTAHDLVLPYLACPLCGAGLDRVDSSLRCPQRHTFDLARKGYASLTTGGRALPRGDTAAMVAAREEFLAAGHYEPVLQAVAETVPPGTQGLVVDVAGGTGQHLAAVLDAHPGTVGLLLDVSRPAVQRAARRHDRALAATADVLGRLPVRDGAARHLLSVFGPRNGPELVRALTPGGALTVVSAAAGHMHELRDTFELIGIDDAKQQRLDARLGELELQSRADLSFSVRLTREDAVRYVLMGPNAFHLDPDDVRTRAERLDEVCSVTAAVTVSRYER